MDNTITEKPNQKKLTWRALHLSPQDRRILKIGLPGVLGFFLAISFTSTLPGFLTVIACMAMAAWIMAVIAYCKK